MMMAREEPRPQGAGARAPLNGNTKKMGRVARRDTNYRIPMTLPPNPMGGLTADIVTALHVARPRGQSNLMPADIRKPRRMGGPGLRRSRSRIVGGLGECLSTYRFKLRSTLIVPPANLKFTIGPREGTLDPVPGLSKKRFEPRRHYAFPTPQCGGRDDTD